MRSLLTEQLLGTCQSESQCPSGAPSPVLPCCYLFQKLLKDSCHDLNYTLYYKYNQPVRRMRLFLSVMIGQVEGICNFANNCYIGSSWRLDARGGTSVALALVLFVVTGKMFAV